MYEKSFNIWDRGIPEALKAISKAVEGSNYSYIGGLAVSIYLLPENEDKQDSRILQRVQYSRNISDFDIAYFGECIADDIMDSLRKEGFGFRKGDILSLTREHDLYIMGDKNTEIPLDILSLNGPNLTDYEREFFQGTIIRSRNVSLVREGKEYAKVMIPGINDMVLTKIHAYNRKGDDGRKKDESDILMMTNGSFKKQLDKGYLTESCRRLGLKKIPQNISHLIDRKSL